MPSKMNEAEARPTLPSIHTLNLPLLASSTSSNVKYQNHDNLRWSPSNPPHNKPYHDRQVSTSSSNTNSSRNSSPSPSDSDMPSPTTKFRLVPCPLETADAAIVVSPPGAPYLPYTTPNYVPRAGKPEGFLCMGPVALNQLRNPRRQHPKGFRIHPYKVVRGPTPSPRRTSVISIISNPPV